jgi:hypothetical protein
MPAKQAKEVPSETPPPAIAANPPVPYRGRAAGYDFYLQSIVEIQKSMGSIESTIKHLCERSRAHEAKLDATTTQINDLAKEIHGAKKVVWIVGSVCGLLGTVGLIFLNKILDVVVAYANSRLPTH